MARGNNKGQVKLTAGAVGKTGRTYDTDNRVALSNREGEGLPPMDLLDQYARSHEANIGHKISEIDAAPAGDGQRYKFVSRLDLQKKSARNAMRDLISRDIAKDPFIAKHATGMDVRSYANDFLERVPAGIDVTLRIPEEHAEQAEARITDILKSYRGRNELRAVTFEATISTKRPDNSRINDKFI